MFNRNIVFFFLTKTERGVCINRLCTAIHYISEGRYIAGMAHRQQAIQSLFPKTEGKIASELQTKRVVKTLTN